MKKHIPLIIVLILFIYNSFAQTYHNPIAGKKSHPDLEITKIEITTSETIIFLKVTNQRSQGGWFCADSDIMIRNTKGNEVFNLIKSENIPTCPDHFEFSYTGQVLEFKLFFPPIPNNIKFIDLIENCSNACFFFNGIILDNDHNKKIRLFEEGFDLYQQKQYDSCISYFEKVLDGDIMVESHIYGLSYYYLIICNKYLGNTEMQEQWYQKLIDSELKEKQTFINELEKSNN